MMKIQRPRDDKLKFAEELEKRTLEFGIRIIRLSCKLPNTPEGRVVRNQITKSGTSIGANYREANRSRSKSDFKNRIAICESEASETQYWLEIIINAHWLSREQIQSEYDECAELVALFTAIGKKLGERWRFKFVEPKSVRDLSISAHFSDLRHFSAF